MINKLKLLGDVFEVEDVGNKYAIVVLKVNNLINAGIEFPKIENKTWSFNDNGYLNNIDLYQQVKLLNAIKKAISGLEKLGLLNLKLSGVFSKKTQEIKFSNKSDLYWFFTGQTQQKKSDTSEIVIDLEDLENNRFGRRDLADDRWDHHAPDRLNSNGGAVLGLKINTLLSDTFTLLDSGVTLNGEKLWRKI